jgi:hypothetical protein
MYECFWKTEQRRYRAGLLTYAFQRIVWIANLKRNMVFYYIYKFTLVFMNNNR